MEFDDVTERVLNEYLVRSRSSQSFDAPMPDAEPFEFCARFFDVLYSQGDVRKRGIFLITARYR